MKKIWVGGGALCLALLIGGCAKTGNLFSFTHKADAAAETNVTVLVSDAQAAVESGNYVLAEELYTKAVAQNPASSEARLGVVNAVTKQIQAQGLDLLSLTRNVTNQNGAPMLYGVVMGAPASARAGYYLFDQTSLETKYKVSLALFERLYKIFITHLGPICNGETDLKAPNIPSIYYANLSFAYLLRGVIKLVDVTEDGTLDYAVYYDETTAKYSVYNSADTGRTNPLTTVPSFDRAGGLSDLDNAITHMTNAKTYSKDSTATLWTQIVDLLTKAKTMITDVTA